MPARAVDGMDAETVHEAAAVAVEHARGGGGPSFLECRTYRYFGHHTAERTMALGYRTDDEIAEWRTRDPLDVVGARLDGGVRAAVDAEVEALLEEAVAFAREGPVPRADEVLDDVYASGLRPRAGVA
jgi:pyruvate dehydrogenase E1 component alpha subunit